ncbi:divalent metal cation transporter [Patescibacteria group bacterium]|nr:MAG: divalent metal cation transporter [Patescibacteria group bacterium]
MASGEQNQKNSQPTIVSPTAIPAGEQRLFTLSEFRRELGVPLILAKKLIVWGEVEAEWALDGTLRITTTELLAAKELVMHPRRKLRLFLRALGPGLVTGASDDDPGGIGTYSSVGARFGLAIIWMALWLLPVMLAVQEACARIGIVTNRGLADVLRQHYAKQVVTVATLLLIVANIANIGADLGAMAAVTQMSTGLNFYFSAVVFALIILLLEVFVKYHTYVKFLKWLTVSLFAYVITGFIVHPAWGEVFNFALLPHVENSQAYVFAMIAVFGTTISPYLFFWQTSEEVEEGKLVHAKCDPCTVHDRMGKMRNDVGIGMLFANIAFFFIVLTTTQVFFKNGIYDIGSAEEAALALRPLAGDYAYLLFSLGIIGTGLLGIPVLAGSGAYALSEVLKWREGLELKLSRAKGFYAVIAFSILVGLLLNFLGINPISALYWSAFLNGVIALPLLFLIMIAGDNKKIMGDETHPIWVRIFGWLAIFFMTMALLTMLFMKVIF